MKIILASKSPRRKKLLKQLHLEFETENADIAEHFDAGWPPPQIVQHLAIQKALGVGKTKKNSLIIGADTIVALNNNILEKPGSEQEAFAMLSRLSGKTHQVYSGVALIKMDQAGNNAGQTTFFEKTDVTFARLDDDEIRQYIAGGSPMDKAGAYGIQDDRGAVFVKKINGDYYNVVGFPLHRFYYTLKTFAPGILNANMDS